MFNTVRINYLRLNKLKGFLLFNCSAQDFRSEIKKEPPVVETGRGFAQWLCRQHNLVNLKLGKSQFDCNLVYERWRDGPKDGSCD